MDNLFTVNNIAVVIIVILVIYWVRYFLTGRTQKVTKTNQVYIVTSAKNGMKTGQFQDRK